MKKILIGMSLALNAIVLLAILFVVIAGSDLMIRYILKPNHDRWVSQWDLVSIQPGDIVFVGDSITRGGSWYELLPDYPAKNRGIDGDETVGVLERLHQITSGKPGTVFLLIGTNDLAFGRKLDEIVSNVVTIVERIKAESPDTTVYVQSVLPRSADYRKQVEMLNAGLQSAIAGKAQWLNLYPLFLDAEDGSIRDDLANDELHLMGQGYLIWRDAILERLDGTIAG